MPDLPEELAAIPWLYWGLFAWFCWLVIWTLILRFAGDSLRDWWGERSHYRYFVVVAGGILLPIGVLILVCASVWRIITWVGTLGPRFINWVRTSERKAPGAHRVKLGKEAVKEREPPPGSVVLHDELADLEYGVKRMGSGIIRERHNVWPEDDEDDPERGKVATVGNNGYVIYQNLTLPLERGTIKIDVKLPEDPKRFNSGVILAAINAAKQPMPEFLVEIDTNRVVVFRYTRSPGDWTEPHLKSKHDLELGTWYEVAVTWGATGMKVAVTNLAQPDGREVTTHPDFIREPMCELVTHFGIGRMYENNAAHNHLLSDLWVTNIQEF